MLQCDKLISPTHQLVAFPGIGYLDAESNWRLGVSGMVRFPYLPTLRKRVLIRVLGNVMGATDDELNSVIFRDRVTSFVMDGIHGLQMVCTIGGRTQVLAKRTKRNGHFHGWIAIDKSRAEALAHAGEGGLRTVSVDVASDQSPDVRGRCDVHLISPRGISVVSDIDDTIKESAIGDRRELLANAFLREFRSVAGMADVYRCWQSQGVAVHYVSSSPWQLLPWISEMIREHNFPQGSFHLRNFRLRTHMLQKVMLLRRSGKTTAIRHLLRKFPARRFLLIGDSGEKDLEVYRKIGRQFSEQIAGILIRELPESEIEPERLLRCRSANPQTVCEVFKTPDELRLLAERLIGNRSA